MAHFSGVQVVPHVTDEQLVRCGRRLELGVLILAGNRPDCQWGSDPDAAEPGLFGPARLPALTRRDYVTNSNDSAWLANPAAPLTGFPIAIGVNTDAPRSVRGRLGLDLIARRLAGTDGLGPPGFTLPTVQATMLANRVHSAELERDDLVTLCRQHPTLPAADGSPVDVRTGCDVLASWDLRADTGSRGIVLWQAFSTALGQTSPTGETPWRVPFDPAEPLTTPRGLDTGNPAVSAALAMAIGYFQTAGIPLDVPLGAVQGYRGVPIHGCSAGCFNVINAGGGFPGPDGTYPEVGAGTSFVMAVELTPTGPRTRSVLAHSQSTDPTSPHETDQTRLYAAKLWVAERFTAAEIAADPELTVTILAPTATGAG